MTGLVHGTAGLEAAQRISKALFSNSVTELGEEDLSQLAQDGMSSSISKDAAPLLTDVLVESGLAITPRGEVTMGQAKKLIQNNGVSVNGLKANNVEMTLDRESALFGKYFVIQKGKKNHHLLVLE